MMQANMLLAMAKIFITSSGSRIFHKKAIMPGLDLPFIRIYQCEKVI
jgi:hypothetical protein